MSVALPSGGPTAVIWSAKSLIICIFVLTIYICRGVLVSGLGSLALAASLAEICSAYPVGESNSLTYMNKTNRFCAVVASGQYFWVAVLAPPKWARGLSYICGWLNCAGVSLSN